MCTHLATYVRIPSICMASSEDMLPANPGLLGVRGLSVMFSLRMITVTTRAEGPNLPPLPAMIMCDVTWGTTKISQSPGAVHLSQPE